MLTIYLMMMILSIAWAVGCQTLADAQPQIEQGLSDGQQIANAVSVFTGWEPSVVFGAGSAVVNAILAINQILMGRRESRLGKILRGIDANPDTPSVLSQLAEASTLAAKDYKLIKNILEKETTQ